MQYLPTVRSRSDLREGVSVRARGARWRIVDVRAYDACRLVTLARTTPPEVGSRAQLIEPFDSIEPIERAPAARVVTAARWRFVCRALLATSTPPGSIGQARSAHIDLLPHQLEPALAIVSGLGTRLLLADEVGLGKTIQAGLVVAELVARGWIDRVLIVTPPGLRDQWVRELSERFGLKAVSVDGRALRMLAPMLPLGANPWAAVPIAVVSSDYVKRAEVLPAVRSCRWDAVIVDEAHSAAGDSDRRSAIETLASFASYVLLLTATPHNGDRDAFAALCGLGASGERDELVVFRRRRSDVRSESRRRVHLVAVAASAAERRMYNALAEYARAVVAERGDAVCLALSMLHKRAFSSPWSLWQSVLRRLDSRASRADAQDAQQLALPLGGDDDRVAEDEPPAWPEDLALGDPASDRRALRAVAEACEAAVADERKLAALRRLLRRANQPAIVFTEFRDTLLHVQRALADVPVVVLHGGMTREERAAALAAFERGPRTILLATDAAGEGLNLQRRCRLVVNLELPWNPMRLEQRIGRVDRIGQTRTVHAFHLVSASSGEARILDRLRVRVARAQTDIGASDPVSGRDEERRMARLAVTGEWLDEPTETRDTPPPSRGRFVAPDLSERARVEVARIEQSRKLEPLADWCSGLKPVTYRYKKPPAPDGTADIGTAAIVRASRTGLRSVLGSRALLVWRVALVNRAGAALESALVAVTVAGLPRHRSPAEMVRTTRLLAEALRPAVERASDDWRGESLRLLNTFTKVRLARERAIVERVSSPSPSQFQPGLFDGRAARRSRLEAQQADESAQHIRDRITAIDRMAEVSNDPPALVLAVLP